MFKEFQENKNNIEWKEKENCYKYKINLSKRATAAWGGEGCVLPTQLRLASLRLLLMQD